LKTRGHKSPNILSNRDLFNEECHTVTGKTNLQLFLGAAVICQHFCLAGKNVTIGILSGF
jgi:hypothetical protein